MLKMFNFIDIGERAESGIPNIFRVWKEQGWARPTFSESFEPERVTLSLPLTKGDDKKVTITTERQKSSIIEYLTDHENGTVADFTELLGVPQTRVKQILYDI